MSYIIGVDGGGTKTKFCLFNTVTGEKIYTTTGESNFKNIGIKKTGEVIFSGLREITAKAGIDTENIGCFVFGIAGCDTEEDFENFEKILKKLGINENASVYNDGKVAFRACSNKDGIIIISGTGSIALSFNKGIERRLGGWGAELSDKGSGYWIGRKFLTDLLLYLENFLDREPVFEDFLKQIKSDVKVIEYIQENFYDVKSIASVTKYVLTSNGKYTDSIVEEVAIYFYDTVKKMNKDFNNEPIDLVLSGSVIKNEKIYNCLKKKIAENKELDNINILLNNSDAVDGCINLALEYLKSK